jgi:ankyrin repeat protein
MASFADDENENDIEEMFTKCKPVIDPIDPMWLLKLSMGRTTLEVVKKVVECMGRAEINIGDGLTLLHIAGQFNRPDMVTYLAGEKAHPTEVRTIHGETPLDQAAWRGNIEAAVELLR